MTYRYEYQTEEERQALLDEYKHLILIEDHIITEGNFLIFSDGPAIVTQPWEDQIADIKVETASLWYEIMLLGSV